MFATLTAFSLHRAGHVHVLRLGHPKGSRPRYCDYVTSPAGEEPDKIRMSRREASVEEGVTDDAPQNDPWSRDLITTDFLYA